MIYPPNPIPIIKASVLVGCLLIGSWVSWVLLWNLDLGVTGLKEAHIATKVSKSRSYNGSAREVLAWFFTDRVVV